MWDAHARRHPPTQIYGKVGLVSVSILFLRGNMSNHDIVKEIREIKMQLAYAKNFGFFFGAGTSCALNVPNIKTLTDLVKADTESIYKEVFDNLITDLKTSIPDPTIENILNRIRQIRSITDEDEKKEYLGISGVIAKEFDVAVCKSIYKIISHYEETANRKVMKKFIAWLNIQSKDFSKEIFTPNYDLIIEKSLEDNEIPYFDGFVGGYEPFFSQESVDAQISGSDLTRNWIRVWKLHGSLSWFWKNTPDGKPQRVVRTGKVEDIDKIKDELVIYPSREKYMSSRKQPFIAYFDKLKSFLNGGELLYIVSGYSFLDEHINEVLFGALRQNLRLSMIVFMYSDAEVERIYTQASSYFNLTVIGPKKGVISGALLDWSFDSTQLKPKESSAEYWVVPSAYCSLGDFNSLVEFLVSSSGRRESIEVVANGK